MVSFSRFLHKNLVLVCEETHSLVLDAITFQYLILVAQEGLYLHLGDNVTVYLFNYLENDIYMKNPSRMSFSQHGKF